MSRWEILTSHSGSTVLISKGGRMTRSGRVRTAPTTRVLKSSGRVKDDAPKIMPTIPNSTEAVGDRDESSNQVNPESPVQVAPPVQLEATEPPVGSVEATHPVELEAAPVGPNQDNTCLDETLSDLYVKRGRGPAKAKRPPKPKGPAKANSPAKAKTPAKAKSPAKGKSPGRGKGVGRGKGPVAAPQLSLQLGSTSSSRDQARVTEVQVTNRDSTSPVPAERSLINPSQNITQVGGTSSHSNTVGGDRPETSDTVRQRKLLTISTAGLEPSKLCSEIIFKSFKHEFDPKGINWKSLSKEFKKFYFGEFKKFFCWDSSIDDSVVMMLWERKASRRYSDFVSKVKTNKIPVANLIPVDILNSWRILWNDEKVVEKSKINSKNRRGEHEVAIGTHTGGSISLGEHGKRLAAKMGRAPTPYELHVHVHSHDHDGKTFIDDRSKEIHDKYKEIVEQQAETQSKVDEFDAFYKAAGALKKRKMYCPSSSQPITSNNLDELVNRLVPALTERMVPILVERVAASISPSSVPVPPVSATDVPVASASDDVPLGSDLNKSDIHLSSSDDEFTNLL